MKHLKTILVVSLLVVTLPFTIALLILALWNRERSQDRSWSGEHDLLYPEWED